MTRAKGLQTKHVPEFGLMADLHGAKRPLTGAELFAMQNGALPRPVFDRVLNRMARWLLIEPRTVRDGIERIPGSATAWRRYPLADSSSWAAAPVKLGPMAAEWFDAAKNLMERVPAHERAAVFAQFDATVRALRNEVPARIHSNRTWQPRWPVTQAWRQLKADLAAHPATLPKSRLWVPGA